MCQWLTWKICLKTPLMHLFEMINNIDLKNKTYIFYIFVIHFVLFSIILSTNQDLRSTCFLLSLTIFIVTHHYTKAKSLYNLSVSVRSGQSIGGHYRETLLSWTAYTACFPSVATPYRTQFSQCPLLLFFPWWTQNYLDLTIYRRVNRCLHLGAAQWHTYISSSLTNRHTLLTNRSTPPFPLIFPPHTHTHTQCLSFQTGDPHAPL